MLRILTALLGIFFCTCVHCQITQRNWLMGGNGSFSHSDETLNGNVQVNSNTIDLSPNIGYFLVDRLAGGVRLNLNYQVMKNSNLKARTTTFLGGPFIRYYFLDKENMINIFSEAAIQFYTSRHKGTNNAGDYETLFDESGINAYTFSAGPAIFFNSSVALELALSYQRIPLQAFNGNKEQNTIALKIGFQIHLEKESN
jgi:hypothetical protein